MNQLTLKFQREAERIASRHSRPAFYVQFMAPMALARRIFFSHPLVLSLRRMVEPVLNEELGHGIFHSSRVGIECATLIHIELESNPRESGRIERLMILGLISGLLHDISRGEENHAEIGAVQAVPFLEKLRLSRDEVACVCQAIRNHEAFITPVECKRPSFQLLSDCLYDADKFRWGPDTFTHTLWYMMNHQGLTPQELIDRFPWGVTGMLRIAETFRTAIGRQFGPEIIETGIEIGREIYRYLLLNYGELS